MVSELLMGVLRGFGSAVAVTAISKHTRDDVLWKKALAPWRRSPMWLLIRVSLQLVISRSVQGSANLYKEVMVFVMSRILKSAQLFPLAPDMIYIMTAKLRRRLYKLSSLGPSILPKSVRQDIDHVLDVSSKSLANQWDLYQRLDSRDIELSTLSTLDFEQDTFVTLPAFEDYIKAMHDRRRGNKPPQFMPASQLMKYKPGVLPELPSNLSADLSYADANLYQFEQWVACHLDDWMANNWKDDACGKLYDLMNQYRKNATVRYYGNPEAISTMVLTIFQLWVACDQAAIRKCPWLSEYDPGIPDNVLQSLLLPFFDQMKRLLDVEEYINRRRVRSTRSTDLLFKADSSHSFASKYFDKSEELLALQRRIILDAEAVRQAKLEEFQQVKAEYRRLDVLYHRTDHKYKTKVIDTWCDPPETEQVHDAHSCQKCSYASERDSLFIQVHEWPLPRDSARAKAVVFELEIPPWFAHWSNARLVLLQDVLEGKARKVNPSTKYLLSTNDPHLTNRYFNRSIHRRINLLSQTKPVLRTHYKNKAITILSESKVCVANGLHYQYYNATSDEHPDNIIFDDAIPRACVYMMPCQPLQRFLFRPASAPDGMSPNAVIASQDTCPANMALEEYKELGAMPLGRHIQWANILVQLAMPSVDFSKLETTLLILQCAYQAGPRLSTSTDLHGGLDRASILRDAHYFFSKAENARSLLECLMEALQRVKNNWESSQALCVFVAIASRALSLSAFSEIQLDCLIFLATARQIAMGWVIDLRDKAYAAVDHNDRRTFIAKSVEVALICISTFDVDVQYRERVLAEENNVSSLIQMSIVVHDGEHGQASDRESHLAILHLRRKRLLTGLYKDLAQYDGELDDAMKKSWAAYQPGSSGWRIVSEAMDHWVTTDTLATTEAPSMQVHYDLISGELLVNGLPLDQVPANYRAQPLYSILFGTNSVEVMPSATPGFQFSATRKFGGFAIELGTLSTGELIIRASKDNVIYETIPGRFIEETYPVFFVQDHVHWFNAATNTLQFRPSHEPWNAFSPAVWTLSQSKDRWQLANSGCSVVGMGTLTSQRISKVLDPLVATARTHNLLQKSGTTKTLLISIPALRLSFTLAHHSGLLVSKEYRSMAVDPDQSLGTLVGLRSKIVLKHLASDERMVLVPEAESVEYRQKNAHAHVTVVVAKASIHTVHALRVDPQLGRLLDNGELGCKLFLAYLHALTSFCLADPLTHRTGTEQALTILRSAAVRSLDQLSQNQINMLSRVARLSPRRCYYPAYLRVMQTVHWDKSLSFLSQHGHFTTAVNSLLQQAEQMLIFYPGAHLKFPHLESDDFLLSRDNVRSATIRVSGYGAEDHSTHYDERYVARDQRLKSQRATRAFNTSRLIFRDGHGRCFPPPAVGSLWQEMRICDTVYGFQVPIEPSSVRYNATLFQDGYLSILQRLPALHRWLGTSVTSRRYRFSIIMWLSTLASDTNANLPVLQVIAMLFKSTALAQIPTPERTSFSPKDGKTCSESELRATLSLCHQPLHSCPEQLLTRRKNENLKAYQQRCKMAWRVARDSAIERFVHSLTTQWPCENPNTPIVQSTYVDTDKAMQMIRPLFKSWYDNRLLDQYLASIEQVMSSFVLESIEEPNFTINAPALTVSVPGYMSEQSIFQSPAPVLPENLRTVGHTINEASGPLPWHKRRREPLLLESVVETLGRLASRSKYENQYVTNLRESLDALVSRGSDQAALIAQKAGTLTSYATLCTEHVNKIYGILEAAVVRSSGARSTAQHPRVSPTFFLQQLSRHRWHELSESWKECVVSYALALTATQRAERLVMLSGKQGEKEALINEIQNSGHQNWSPLEQPETLLMEVENGFLVREVQALVAAQMRDRQDGNNAVMQLNMGEGKSSVIVPIVAAALADGKQLLRVIVAKPQSKQMAQMLISKLGGLLDRRVYYMPVSRSLKLDRIAAVTISNMLHDCMSSGGILLMQPEHILSFQLMSPECYILGRKEDGQQLMSTQDFFDQNARDIVDESDENFSVRFELIYTMGTQRPIELSPDRWMVLQQLLDLVRVLAPGVAQDLPLSLEYHPGVPGSFPRIRILRPDAGTLLIRRLADCICKNGLDGLQVSRQPEDIRNAIHTYITKAELDVEEINAVESSGFWTETTSPVLLLIRGLFACGVLEFVLGQKRWRVNYGLATRMPPTQLAVPYRAKDCPSSRSEFSHPDVVIALTSLSYYYGGLSDEDLFIAMGRLMELDQSDVEYQTWVQDAPGLPASFKQLQGINLKDRPLCISAIFPALRFAKSVIDSFLSRTVFPKEMKEFPHKLSASGWDIGKRKSRVLTGFSGTNDSRCLLPIDVHHLDLSEQRHTNALVLEYILQPENGVALMQPAQPHTSDAEHVLAEVLGLGPPVQVILDVGAQILELNNLEVAKTWLRKHERTKEAAVFVNDEDELCVVDREDKVDLLRASSFLSRLDSCLIFLDEAHTRGIDLRLPSHYRAAVTLGAGLTKDRLVQACMRMRKLGKGQTVVFCISQEIQAKITQHAAKTRSSDITVSDAILWSISETHAEIRRSMPLWAVQGERHFRQKRLWQEIHQDGRTLLSTAHAKRLQEKEAQSLDDRFRPRQRQSLPRSLGCTSDDGFQRIAARCRQVDELKLNASTLQEEQERELSPEIEQERQVQRAPAAEPAEHSLHADILRFAIHGNFKSDSVAYMPAFEALKDSSAANIFPVRELACEDGLLVSADFAKTVVPSRNSSHVSDAFQRPVQWLLTSREKDTAIIDRMIIISPYEANSLYKRMESSTYASMHIYKPRCNSGYASLDRLDFHTISAQTGAFFVPRRLAIQLGIFSGQLYINSYEDYQEMCSFLGLSTETVTEEMSEQGWKIAADGFILSDDQSRVGGRSGLHESPVGFLKILMSRIRRNGDSVAKTHMGKLLEGKVFNTSDF